MPSTGIQRPIKMSLGLTFPEETTASVSSANRFSNICVTSYLQCDKIGRDICFWTQAQNTGTTGAPEKRQKWFPTDSSKFHSSQPTMVQMDFAGVFLSQITPVSGKNWQWEFHTNVTDFEGDTNGEVMLQSVIWKISRQIKTSGIISFFFFLVCDVPFHFQVIWAIFTVFVPHCPSFCANLLFQFKLAASLTQSLPNLPLNTCVIPWETLQGVFSSQRTMKSLQVKKTKTAVSSPGAENRSKIIKRHWISHGNLNSQVSQVAFKPGNITTFNGESPCRITNKKSCTPQRN